ncbi:MAG TPA: transposase, partial [Ktedonobacterales bacterium]|nr:transposase [Ktedonobacterales bacterium]
MNTPDWEALRAFRQQVYNTAFGCRRDALFEALDAVLAAPTLETPAHLSLTPSCRRGWGSLYDALNAETMNVARLETLVASYPLDPPMSWYAVDASVWPRCDAETSPERGYYHHPYRQSHGQPIVAGWNYSWLAQLPPRCSSWTVPLRVRRIIPGENSNLVAAEQIRSWLGQAPPVSSATPLPIFTFDATFDAGYDPVQLSLALADLPLCPSASWCACARAAASMPTQPPSPRPGDRGAMGRSSSAVIRRRGRSPLMPGRP